MEKSEIQKLIDVRSYLIHKYNGLDGKQSPTTSVILQRDVAKIISEAIRKIDNLLGPHVQIKKK
jgi:uncharacterized protein YutE (UPF0331/DUF86 family)